MKIKVYSKADEEQLFNIMREEGPEWENYCGKLGIEKYKVALINSITYVAYVGNELCGFVRCRDDDGFGVYVYDLLVKKAHRGNSYGRMLIERVCLDHPNDIVYVMSDVDEYYEKQEYRREGSIFKVHIQQQ